MATSSSDIVILKFTFTKDFKDSIKSCEEAIIFKTERHFICNIWKAATRFS